MIPTQDLNRVREGLALLTDMYKGRKNIEGILSSYLARAQDLEVAIWAASDARLLANAIGAQLDAIGRIVGEPRGGRLDDDFRAAIRLRIRVNRSNGKAEELIQIARLAMGSSDFSYEEFQPLKFRITAANMPQPNTVARLLGQARSGGVRGVLQYATWTSDLNLTFRSVDGSAPATRYLTTTHGTSPSPGRLLSVVDCTP